MIFRVGLPSETARGLIYNSTACNIFVHKVPIVLALLSYSSVVLKIQFYKIEELNNKIGHLLVLNHKLLHYMLKETTTLMCETTWVLKVFLNFHRIVAGDEIGYRNQKN